MTNKEIAGILKVAAQLGDLHDENPFKVKALSGAAFQIERMESELISLDQSTIESVQGIGKSIAQKIIQIMDRGSFDDLDLWIQKTPAGVLQMLKLKGIGAKKVKALWQELGIESIGELLYACKENRLVTLKGFGEKTQNQIIQSIQFLEQNQGKMLYADAEAAFELLQEWIDNTANAALIASGEFRRQLEVLDEITCIVRGDFDLTLKQIEQHPEISAVHYDKHTIDFVFAGRFQFRLHKEDPEFSAYQLAITTGPFAFNEHFKIKQQKAESEEKLYQQQSLPYVLPELRDLNPDLIEKIENDALVKLTDFKGILHCHSKYSDGANTLKEMADACKEMGLEYFGICDHSRSAQYAGGLHIDRVIEQHCEIDLLNQQYGDGFKVFKGIESDILNDGSLDYPDEVLKQFDFVVASVHSNLKMTEEKAMSRLIKAIENPFTTILGHLTGRLLLSRNGYPVDHHKIIDACAANNVTIELNAHPFRLDIDWRWIPYCMDKGVKIAINPDAHEIEGLKDIKYGVLVARKGGLNKNFLLNSMNKTEIGDFFQKKKSS
ncbi:MAG: helix-hairpin-helix domain-containing protein [Flavobacteriales bacterium]